MRVLAGFLLLLPFVAGADECARLPLPSVVVKRLQEPVSYNTTLDYPSLNVLASSEERPVNRVLGLTRGNARVSFDVRTSSLADRSGRWECASPQIVVSYGFSPLTVYVAREFAKGSCAYNEILAHELRHVKTYQDHLLAIEHEISAALTRRFATGAPWRGPVGQTFAQLEREMNERWLPYIKREIERVESAQALIDTPEEYSRVSDSCNGDIQRLIHQG